MMGKKRVFLWGWFGYKNFGDDLLLNTMIGRLQKIDNVEITIPMKQSYPIQYSNVKQIRRSHFNVIVGALKQDVLIIGPGGLFPFDNKVKVLLYYLFILFWKGFDRKVIFFGVGISERLSDKSSVIWNKIIAKSDLFITRSSSILRKLQVQETDKVYSMADTVFGADCNFTKIDEETKCVAISVANLLDEYESIQYKEAVSLWSQVVGYLLDNGYTVDLVAFTKRRDDNMIGDIISKVNREGVHAIYYDAIFEAIGSWGIYDFIVCMRFHALVLSILATVPAIPIAYGHKTEGLAKDCGLQDYLLIWNSFQSDYYGEKIGLSVVQIIDKIRLLRENLSSVKKHIARIKCDYENSVNIAFERLINSVIDD